MSFKKVWVRFQDSDFDYVTNVNSSCTNEEIFKYFVGQLFSGHKCVAVEFEYRVISGSFTGQVGFINPFRKYAFLPLLTVSTGNKLAVTFNQLEQVQ